jgi:hypothetical protein
MTSKSALIFQQDSLVSFWDFQEAEGQSRVAKGPFPYVLDEMSGPIKRVEDGVLGTYAAKLEYGQWFNLPRKDCPALDLYGLDAKLTVFAWLKREKRVNGQCEAIAGMWNETEKKRQYAMFLNLRIWERGSSGRTCFC